MCAHFDVHGTIQAHALQPGRGEMSPRHLPRTVLHSLSIFVETRDINLFFPPIRISSHIDDMPRVSAAEVSHAPSSVRARQIPPINNSERGGYESSGAYRRIETRELDSSEKAAKLTQTAAGQREKQGIGWVSSKDKAQDTSQLVSLLVQSNDRDTDLYKRERIGGFPSS